MPRSDRAIDADQDRFENVDMVIIRENTEACTADRNESCPASSPA